MNGLIAIRMHLAKGCRFLAGASSGGQTNPILSQVHTNDSWQLGRPMCDE